MMDPLTAIMNLVKTGLEKWIPDANAREAAAAQIAAQVHAQTMAQIEVNKVEAASASLFVAGWRPFIGWTCGVAYGYSFVLQPALVFLAALFHWPLDKAQLPILEMGELGVMLFGMLGLAGYRTYEKVAHTKSPN